MKYLLCLFALMATMVTQAQSFEWNSKSPAPTQVTRSNADQAAYEKAYNERQVGMAGTYYGTAEGRQTAYGETFRNSAMTASHRLLPLGTLLQVINLDNGKRATVRVNDRGQACTDCLLQLSATAASSLGIQGYGQVSVERVGFSNWNPTPPTSMAQAPVTYNNAPSYTPSSYGAPAPSGGVVRPVSIGGETVGWNAKGGSVPQTEPTSYGSVATYSQQPGQVHTGTVQTTPNPQANAVVLSAPSVLSREVDPATRANQPTTFSRRPTMVIPQPQPYSPTPSPQSYYQSAPAYQQPQPYYGQPTYTAPQPVQQSPAQVVPQAAAPQPTVERFQARGGTVTPESYGQPVNVPTSYAAVPAAPIAAPAPASAPGSRPGFVVQLGAYNNELYAKNRVTQLQGSGLVNVFYVASKKPDGQVINRVYAGTFPSMADAQVVATDIRNDYQIAGIVTRL